jgi:hypothetical protein
VMFAAFSSARSRERLLIRRQEQSVPDFIPGGQ